MSDREQRNAVFGKDNSGIQAVDRVKAELGLDIPVADVPLPSLGKVYPEGSPLYNAETVQVRAMTTREEDILTSVALIKKGTVIGALIKSCLVDPNIDVQDMIAGDRNSLMVAIRITGYGAEYTTDIQCPGCDRTAPFDFRLDQLELKQLEIDPVSPGQNIFAFNLPVCKKTVHFRFLTGRDEEEISAAAQKMKKVGIQSDSLITTNLQHAIVAVDGKADPYLVNAFIRKMPARDSLLLRNYMRKNEPGINMNQDFVCSACGHVQEVTIPIGPTFFWPQA
jgi:hypothetical protein